MKPPFYALAIALFGIVSCGDDTSGSSPATPTDASADGADAPVDAPAPDGGIGTTVGVVVIPPGYDASEQGVKPVVDAALAANVGLLSWGYAQWAAIEKAPGEFDFGEFDGFLAAIEGQPFAHALDVATPVAPFGIDVPGDLTFTTFEDQGLRDRYHAFLRATAQFAPAQTSHLTLHVEGATEYFAEHPELRDGFCSFVASAIDVVHQERPSLRVGVYWRYEDRDASLRDCVAGTADYLGLAFVLNPPGDTLADVPQILDFYLDAIGTQPLAIVEAGWPSAERFSSSETIQAEFVRALFAAVAERNDRVEFVSYYTVFDEDRQVATAWVTALFPDMPEASQQALIDWVCSLGLLRADATPKASWGAFVEALE